MNKVIKVAHFVSRLEFGGVEAMLLNYIKHMKSIELFEMHIITQDINDPKCIKVFENAGFIVHIVTHKRKSIFKNVKDVYKIIHTEKFDIIHSHMNLTNFYVLLIGMLFGVKTRISHMHSALKNESFKKRIAYPILKSLNKMFSNVWVACGYAAGKFLYGKRSIEKGKVIFVHNAIDLNKFYIDETVRYELRTKLNIENKVCIGHIGRFMKVKNHTFLIDILSEALKINPNVVLLLVGDGELQQEIIQYAEKMNVLDNVIFTGNVLNTVDYYQVMDVFVLPSFYEGLPVVSVEAQAMGLPCLVSENVDKECKLTDNVFFKSIDISAQEWAKDILNIVDSNCYNNRKSEYEALTKCGYNIDVESMKLEKLYIDNSR